MVGDDEFNLAVIGTFIITNTIYWTVGGIYSYFDITGTPEFLRKYKVSRIKVIFDNQTEIGYNYTLHCMTTCDHITYNMGSQHWVPVPLGVHEESERVLQI